MLSSPDALLSAVVMSACMHSTWVISDHSISVACCVDRSGASSGRSSGAGKCASRKILHSSYGIVAFRLSCFVIGSLEYVRATVELAPELIYLRWGAVFQDFPVELSLLPLDPYA